MAGQRAKDYTKTSPMLGCVKQKGMTYLHKMVMKQLIINDSTLHVKLNIYISVL